MSLPRVVVPAIVFLALGACGGDATPADGSSKGAATSETKAAPPGGSAKTSGATSSSAAPAYTSTEGRFEIDFRGETPKLSEKDDPNGGKWKEAAMPGGAAMVQYTDYASHAHAVAEVKGFIPTREKERIKVDKDTKVGGLEGRDIEMTLSSGKIFWIRFLISDSRVYKVGAAFPEEKRAEATSFVESFKVLPAGGASPPAASASAR